MLSGSVTDFRLSPVSFACGSALQARRVDALDDVSLEHQEHDRDWNDRHRDTGGDTADGPGAVTALKWRQAPNAYLFSWTLNMDN